MSFENKVVLVTGASSGIGAAVAEAFSAEGAKVAMVARNKTKLEEVAARCNDPLVLRADLSKDDDIRHIVNKTIEKFGQIDILVNNAATFAAASLFANEVMESYDHNMRVNVRAVIYLTSLAAPHLIKTKGNIVNISSISANIPPATPTLMPYSVSKAALNHFTTCSAAEMAAYGVRVNAISPGPVVTNFLESTGFPGSWDMFKSATLLNRVSDAKEIADLVIFLASDKAKGVTGVNYLSDNGMTIKR